MNQKSGPAIHGPGRRGAPAQDDTWAPKSRNKVVDSHPKHKGAPIPRLDDFDFLRMQAVGLSVCRQLRMFHLHHGTNWFPTFLSLECGRVSHTPDHHGAHIHLNLMNLVERLQDYLRTVRSTTGIARMGNWLFFGALIGTVSGLGAIAFTAAIDFLQHLSFATAAGVSLPTEAIEPTTQVYTGTEQRHWLFLVLPALGGLGAGWLVFRFAPEAEGHGTDEVIRAYHHDRARIRRRVPLIKALASALTIGSGGSAGREGPVAQIGAGFRGVSCRPSEASGKRPTLNGFGRRRRGHREHVPRPSWGGALRH